jgi:hypothetical protein
VRSFEQLVLSQTKRAVLTTRLSGRDSTQYVPASPAEQRFLAPRRSSYISKDDRHVPENFRLLANDPKSIKVPRRYICEGNLFNENTAAAVGL